MTEKTRAIVDKLVPWATLLALGLGALLAYSEARFTPADVYAQEHAALTAQVADVRTDAATSQEEIRGDVKAIKAELAAQGRTLERVERLVEQLATERRHSVPRAQQ